MFCKENRIGDTKSASQGACFFQPKLTINQPNDSFEQEADAMADRVMRMTGPQSAQNSFFTPATGALQRKCQACEEEEKHVHRKEDGSAEVSDNASIAGYINNLASSGRPMNEASRKFFEPRFGHDFSGVRLHTDSVAAKSAQSINALAYTSGNNIVFNTGQYAPDSDGGRRLMAHELTHVIQQKGSVQPKLIQRLPGSPAGGCGLCYETTKHAGIAAHEIIQKAFLGLYPWLQKEFPVLSPPWDPDGKLDLADLKGRDHMDIGEIKPDNPGGEAAGEADLVWYDKQLRGLGMSTSRMGLPPPIAGLPFPTLAPAGCPQMQQLFVNPSKNGVYTYFCTPDYKDLIKECDCKKGKRKVPVPKVVPVPVPKTVPKEEKKNVPDQPVPVPLPQPEVNPQPVPVNPPPVPVTPPVVTPSPTPASGVPTWVYVAGGAAGAALIAACFLSGACELAAIVAAFGAAAEDAIAFLVGSGVVLQGAR